MLLFDAHLDLAWNALSWNRDLTTPLTESRETEKVMTDHPGRGKGTVSLPDMRRGEVAVCLATLLCRANANAQKPVGHARRDLDCATQEIACAHARGQLGYYRLLEELGEATIVTTSQRLDQHWQRWQQHGGGGNAADEKLPVGLIIAMEGADPIVSPAQAERWFADGLRTVGIAHFGPSAYGVGTGTAGPLTHCGVELLKELDRLGFILDLTHSSDPTFFQALEIFRGPVHASHNNARTLVPGDRQYSDEQIQLLIQRGGVIGAVCDNWQLHSSYTRGETPRELITLNNVANTIDHICQLAGNTNHVGIGSDLDGGFGTEQSPLELDTIADLQKLAPILASRGYSQADIAKIFHGNWLRFFRENLPKE